MEKANVELYQIILENEDIDCEVLCWKGEKHEELWDRYTWKMKWCISGFKVTAWELNWRKGKAVKGMEERGWQLQSRTGMMLGFGKPESVLKTDKQKADYGVAGNTLLAYRN